ncbi:hypothetical protein GCM10018785_23920 [Streptomyces longispororuber]|uniref:Uncharacterized protein n=1 Tax=Streptomyces longispororuber TaxID=68230 RepID=A0A918ZHU1_9ACTN|nr:hypothetical protein [Streptomyces longispororuber]GHE53591.1 hypothetical protein GCM10018785_23920 [Streptomyces longispororuber]
MPEETTPSPAPAPDAPEPGAPSGSFGAGCGGVILVGVLLVAGTLAWNSWAATDFPRVAPAEMADRAVQRSQEAYTVMGFKRTIEPGVRDAGVSTQNTLSSNFCYDNGLLGIEDKIVDGAYSMSHTWALDHVPASQAVPGLRRLHRYLGGEGWRVTSYREGERGGSWDLLVQRHDGEERMSFSWYPDREYFTGGTSVPCAYDPKWKDGHSGPAGDDESPPALGPAQRD